MRTCSCGAPLEEGAAFCTKCGKRQDPVTQRMTPGCPNCGAPLEPGSAFCTQCGAGLGGPRPAQPTRPAQPAGGNGGNGNGNGANVGIIAAAVVIAALIIGIVVWKFVLPQQDVPANINGNTNIENTTTNSAHTHSWSAYSSNGDATCTQDGTKTRTCSSCGQRETVTDSNTKLAHNYSNGKCTRCGAADPNAKGGSVTLTVRTASGGTLTGTVRRDAQGYVLGNSSSHVYTESEIRSLGLNAAELVIARNEIFARHGYDFANDGLQSYFNNCSWYHNSGSKPSLTPGSAEDKNSALLLQMCKDMYPEWVDLAH